MLECDCFITCYNVQCSYPESLVSVFGIERLGQKTHFIKEDMVFIKKKKSKI